MEDIRAESWLDLHELLFAIHGTRSSACIAPTTHFAAAGMPPTISAQA
jgi:hypothetical protein